MASDEVERLFQKYAELERRLSELESLMVVLEGELDIADDRLDALEQGAVLTPSPDPND